MNGPNYCQLIQKHREGICTSSNTITRDHWNIKHKSSLYCSTLVALTLLILLVGMLKFSKKKKTYFTKNKSLWMKIKKILDFYLILDMKSKIVTTWKFLVLSVLKIWCNLIEILEKGFEGLNVSCIDKLIHC